MTLPASTTNITGLRATSRGSSLTNDWPTAGQIKPRIEAALRVCSCACSLIPGPSSEEPAGVHQIVLDDRPQRERREVGESADDEDDAHEQHDEDDAGGREGAARGRHGLLGPGGARQAGTGEVEKEAAPQHAEAADGRPEGAAGRETGKGAAV